MNHNRASEITFAILRFVTGLLFLCHGGQKLFGWFGGFGGQPGATAPLASMMGAAGVIELVGGILLMVGLFTRPAAFLICGEMAFAYFTAHAPHGFWPIVNHGEPAVLFCFVALMYSANGAGRYSFDALMHSRPHRVVHTGIPAHV